MSEEGKKLNVERLKAYKAKLIVFPRKTGKPKKGDSTVCLFFWSLQTGSLTKLYRAMISQRPLPGQTLPCLIHTLQRPLVKSQLKNGNSKPTKHFKIIISVPGTRVLVNSELPRFAIVN